jgi:hypothetical protein
VDVSYSTAIGYNSVVTRNNQIAIGTSSENVNIQGNVFIGNTQDSTGSTTGALVVQGGAGIQGNLYVQNNIYMNGILVGTGGGGGGQSNTFTGDVSFNSGNVYINNTLPSTSTTTGSLIIKGGVGVQGNIFMKGGIFVGGVIPGTGIIPNTSSFTEYMTELSYASDLLISFTTNLIYYVSGTPMPITSLTITSLPTTSLASFTFTFIMATTNSANNISISTITINGYSYTVLGSNIVGTPLGYIIQQFTIFNTSSTSTPSYAVITSATEF